jgi:diacylglycerol kinase family enzyme
MADIPQSSRWVRPAAVVGLVAMAGIVAIVVAGVVRELADVFIAVVSLFFVAFCAWFVLTRRGVARALGLLGVVLGVLALIAFAETHGLLVAMLAGTLVLFGGTARYAVRHDNEAFVSTAHTNGHTPRAARKGVLIINPISGGGKAERFHLLEEARKRGVEPLLLGPGDDLGELAKGAVRNGADAIGMAGGDGSQAMVATVAMRHDVAHVCIPSGTRNHFALDLGLDRDDVVGALDAFTDGVERRIDLACVNEHVFVNNASLGLYAHVVQSDEYRDAKFGTWKRALPDLLGPDAEPIDLRFEGPDGSNWTNADLVMVSNNPHQLKRLGGAGTRHRLDSGRLGILATRIRRARDLAKLVTLGSMGQATRFRGLSQWSALEFEVRSDAPVAVGLDGEGFLIDPPLRFVSLPRALRVRMPRKATGVSPAGAAVTVTRRDFRRLLRIAVGKPGSPITAAARANDELRET